MPTETAHKRIQEITARIRERSKPTREAYLGRVREAASNKPKRAVLGCANLAHGFAACGPHDKAALTGDEIPNLGIITAYNDMLSAHQPFETFRSSSSRLRVKQAAWRRLQAACPPCAMVSRKGSRAWNCRCSPAK